MAQPAPSLAEVFAFPTEDAAPASVVLVEPTADANAAQPSGGLVPDSWRPASTRLNWIDYSLLAATTAAAVLAIHYKFEADALYDDYDATGDPALRPRIKALDVRSGVATGAMQAGVVVFGARLLLR